MFIKYICLLSLFICELLVYFFLSTILKIMTDNMHVINVEPETYESLVYHLIMYKMRDFQMNLEF